MEYLHSLLRSNLFKIILEQFNQETSDENKLKLLNSILQLTLKSYNSKYLQIVSILLTLISI